MIDFPPIPQWDGLHPLIIHFPIALLLVAPLLVVVGIALRPEKGRPYLLSALILMALGTASVYLAVSTGEAAGRLAVRTAAVEAILEGHEEMAETVQVVYSVLTVVFASILFLPRMFDRPLRRTATSALLLVFLGFYAVGALLLTDTAHNGGRLVHEQGVTALMPEAPLPTLSSEADDEDDEALAAPLQSDPERQRLPG